MFKSEQKALTTTASVVVPPVPAGTPTDGCSLKIQNNLSVNILIGGADAQTWVIKPLKSETINGFTPTDKLSMKVASGSGSVDLLWGGLPAS